MQNPSARDPLTERIIGLAIGVHRALGPGLLESAYEECLCFELGQAEIPYARQVPLPIRYKDVRLDCGYRLDLVVNRELIIEIKAVEKLAANSRRTNPNVFTVEPLPGRLIDEFQFPRPEGWNTTVRPLVSASVLSVSLW
jgi:GxxExxY protein